MPVEEAGATAGRAGRSRRALVFWLPVNTGPVESTYVNGENVGFGLSALSPKSPLCGVVLLSGEAGG